MSQTNNTFPKVFSCLSDYTMIEQLYSGSRTIVYRALENSSQRSVVIKLLKQDYPSFNDLLQFRNQYTITKNLNITGIISPYRLESCGNSYALVTEDWGGISLRQYAQENSLALQEILAIALQLAQILHDLHQVRVIHKDIKPANILIQPESMQVKLIDFSIASLLPQETQEIQNPNALEGTLAYLAPEQTGRMNRGIDYRADFYSLGVTLFELFSEQLPFQSNDLMELVHCHLAKQPPNLTDLCPTIPSVLSEIVAKLMAKNAEDRYQSALGLQHDLQTCLSQLEATGQIDSFSLALQDRCDRFLIPEKLYGREAEVKQLLAAFERVVTTEETELMLVAGFSGVGKTAVVHEVHKPIVRQRGYFIQGKYDQLQRDVPFSAFVQAFRDLMGQLLSESDTQIQAWKIKILDALGDNGQILIDVIPELKNIIGEQFPATELFGPAAQNRFNLLLQKFVQAFTSNQHPLVMFLDDLQWADSASLNLLKILTKNTKHLLILGAYRDNEVSPVHPFVLTVNDLVEVGAPVNIITLPPLNEVDTNCLVADTLNCALSVSESLTNLIYQKTKGNPFFVTQFLKSLYAEKLINFDWRSGHWQCDIAQVQALAITDDVVEFMAVQLQKLPTDTQDMLKLAACIGAEFDLKTLAVVGKKSTEMTAVALWKALQEGLVIPTSKIYKFFTQAEDEKILPTSANATYRFLHDRVQQSAYSLIPENQKQATHYSIGQLLLQELSPTEREERIFELVNQLNYGTALIDQQSERDKLARLNLTACHKAKTATAYQLAREYASVGLSLLGKKAWQNQYKITLALHELAVEVASLSGDFEQMEQWVSVVTSQTHSLLEQVNVCRIRIQANTSQNKLVEAVSIGKEFLQRLGVTFPESPTPKDVEQEIQEINQLIGNRKIEELVQLPVMTDLEKLAIVQIANSCSAPAYKTGSLLFSLIIALTVKISIQYGNTSASAFSYACYGLILCNVIRDIKVGTAFGELAVNINSTLENKAVQAEVSHLRGMFLLHRKLHIRETLPVCQETYLTGLEVGNLEFAAYGLCTFSLNSFWCSQPLIELEKNIHICCDQLIKMNQLKSNASCQTIWQSILNLLNFVETPGILSGEVLQETEFLPQLLSANDFYGLYTFYLYKMILCFCFGEIEIANSHALKCREYLKTCAGTVCDSAFYLYDSLISLAQMSQDFDEVTKIFDRIEKNQSELEHLAHYAPMNYQHKFNLVEAEKYRILGQNPHAKNRRILGQNSRAIELYEQAIFGAKENGYLQEEALANELAAKFYLDWGKEKVAAGYLQEAYYCYARWGAKTKTRDLEMRYPNLLRPILQKSVQRLNILETLGMMASSSLSSHSTTDPNRSSASTSINSALDFSAILKASQSLSSTIQLDELLHQLTQIILKNSGGDRCALILPNQAGEWLIEAISTAETTELGGEPLHDNTKCVPVKLVQYIKNTQESVVIDDLKTHLPVIDEYLTQQQPKSIFCLPVLNQGKLLGILYLENRATSGAFTSDRLLILNFLCTQAAISLENARLYQQAQTYSQQLEQSQLQIVQSEKMASLGNLVAGVAHEINNPIGFLNGSLRNTKDYVQDLLEHLALYQQQYPEPVEAITDHAESIDLELLHDDLPKLVNSLQGATDRIKSISTSLRIFSRADTQSKVKANLHEGIDSTLLILKYRLKANEHRPAIQITQDYGDLPLIDCFPGQLNQVFMNLLANAIDVFDEVAKTTSFDDLQATPQKITIKTTLLVAKNAVEICICDNGLGMTQEVKQKIFDHLFTTKGVGKGTGLGLSIARQIVTEKHGGTLTVESELGQGSKFSIQLPL